MHSTYNLIIEHYFFYISYLHSKLRYIRHEMFGDFNYYLWGTFEFYLAVFIYLFALWIRIYVHYLAQYLYIVVGCLILFFCFQVHFLFRGRRMFTHTPRFKRHFSFAAYPRVYLIFPSFYFVPTSVCIVCGHTRVQLQADGVPDCTEVHVGLGLRRGRSGNRGDGPPGQPLCVHLLCGSGPAGQEGDVAFVLCWKLCVLCSSFLFV